MFLQPVSAETDLTGHISHFTQLKYEDWITGETKSYVTQHAIASDYGSARYELSLESEWKSFLLVFPLETLKNKECETDMFEIFLFSSCERNPLGLNNYLCVLFQLRGACTGVYSMYSIYSMVYSVLYRARIV